MKIARRKRRKGAAKEGKKKRGKKKGGGAKKPLNDAHLPPGRKGSANSKFHNGEGKGLGNLMGESMKKEALQRGRFHVV